MTFALSIQDQNHTPPPLQEQVLDAPAPTIAFAQSHLIANRE